MSPLSRFLLHSLPPDLLSFLPDSDKPFFHAFPKPLPYPPRSRRSPHKPPFRIGLLLWSSMASILLFCFAAFFVIVISAAFMTRANELGRICHGGSPRPPAFSDTKERSQPFLLLNVDESRTRRSLSEIRQSVVDAESPIIMQTEARKGRQMPMQHRDERWKNVTMKMAMVTCTDGGERVRGRSFAGIMEMVAPNKQSYADRHGYRFIDASHLLDRSRPPSWSKILAVRHHLPLFQWVFWNDADSLVTNPDIRLEDILISVSGTTDYSEMPDFIVTRDVTGVNAGMFFFRNTAWSMQFLDIWWNQTSFIREMGQMKSGDNDALKYLLARMPKEEFRKHVAVPPMQCAFNSYPWGISLKNIYRMIVSPESMWRGVYSTGDFMVHLAGLNEKKASIQRILSQLQFSTEGHTWRNYI